MAVDAPAPPSPSSRLRTALARLLGVASLVLATWAALIWVTGGFVVRLGPIRISSRNPRNALVVAAAGSVLTWLTATREERRRFRENIAGAATRLKPHTAAIAAGAAATVVLVIGIVYAIGTAAGSDAYGYVSQGELWMHGLPRIEEPFAAQVDWPNETAILSPLGYRPAADGTSIVPVYPPGFPLILALFERLGGRPAVFYAVPLLGALAVMATYLLASFVGGRGAGALAAMLLATSPPFLFQDLFAMSDVPATFWWACSLLVFVTPTPVAAAAAGLAAGMGILTRPNLVPLALAPAAALAWCAVRSREPGPVWTRLLLFCAGTGAGCLALAVINAKLYDSALASGYGQVGDWYSWGSIRTNARLYTMWTLRSQTVLVLCAVAAPMTIAWRSTDDVEIARRAAFAGAIGLLGLTVASYLPYAPFDRWFWLRFLLPAWPSLVVLVSLGLLWLCGRVAGQRAVALAAAIVVVVGVRNILFLKRDGAFKLQEGERKSPAIGRYIADNMSERAVFLAQQQSGSVRYYSGRLTLSFDAIPPAELDRVLADLVRLGFHPYAIFEESEEAGFRSQFAAQSVVGALDWAPIVRLRHSTRIQIYDLIDLERQKLEGHAPRVVF